MANLLANGNFEGTTYEPHNQMALVLPQDWEAGCLDEGRLIRYSRAGADVYGAFDKHGPRGSDYVNLKPEILVIPNRAPYLDPPRILEGVQGVTGFKWSGTVCWWLMQTVAATPGATYRAGASAHAWSRMETDPNDAHYTNGVGRGAFFALEGQAGLNDGQRNYRFRLGIDPFGGRDPFGSAVVWGAGAHIYNVFDAAPALEAMARADSITVFLAVDCLYGMENSNAFWDAAMLEQIETPIVPPVIPPVDYVVCAHLAPQDVTPAEIAQIGAVAFPLRQSVVCSADDAARLVVPGKPGSKVCVWWPARWTAGDIVAWLHNKGVSEVETFPKVEPPPVEPPPAAYERPESQGGVHVNFGPRDGYGPFLRECGKSILVKSVMDFGVLLEAKEIQPGTVTVVRVYPIGGAGDDTPPGNWQWGATQSRRIADDWMARCYPVLDRNTFTPDFVEVINEPDPSNVDAMLRAEEFMMYCLENAEAHGVKLAIWAWTAGLPRTPRIRADDFPQMEIILPSLRWAAEHGHAYAVHEGSVNPARRTLRQGAEDQTALRYRVTAQLMRERGWQMPPVVITEAYQEGGYLNPDWDDWHWYLNELKADPYVLGCAWFTLGDYNGQNVMRQLPGYASLIRSM